MKTPTSKFDTAHPLDEEPLSVMIEVFQRLSKLPPDNLNADDARRIAITQFFFEAARHIARVKAIDARPNPKLLGKITKYVRSVSPGEAVVHHVKRRNIPVYFFSGDFDRGGDFSIENQCIRVKWDPKDINEITMLELQNLARIYVHEARHSLQGERFPELFSNNLDTVDTYVARKIIEFDTRLGESEFLYNAQMGMLFGSPTAVKILEEYGLSPDVVNATVSWNGANTNGKKLNDVLKSVDWVYYERRMASPHLLEMIQSGLFKERVAASRFLETDFLTRFCVDWNGTSYLPKNPRPFLKRFRENIATLHHPLLAELAATAAPNEKRHTRRAAPLTPAI